MDSENEKLFKTYRNLITNSDFSMEKFVEAWVSHVIPGGQNLDEEHENSAKANSLKEEDDITLLDPGDSASQVGNIGQQIQNFFEGRCRFSLRNGTTPKQLPPRIKKLIEQLTENVGQRSVEKISSPSVKKRKIDNAGAVSHISQTTSKKNSSSKPSTSRKISSAYSETFQSTVANKSPEKNFQQAEVICDEQNEETCDDESSSKSYESADGDMFDEIDNESVNYFQENPCDDKVEQEKVGKNDKSRSELPTKSIKITRQSVLTLIDRYTDLDYDDAYVDAVHAAGFVFLRRVMKNLKETAEKNGRDCVKRRDVLDLYEKLGLKYDEDDLNMIETVFQPKSI